MRILPLEIIRTASDARLPASGEILRTPEEFRAFWDALGKTGISCAKKLDEGTVGIALSCKDYGMSGYDINAWGMDRGDIFEIGWAAVPPNSVQPAIARAGHPTAVAVFPDPDKPIRVRRLEPGPQVAAFLGVTPPPRHRNNPSS